MQFIDVTGIASSIHPQRNSLIRFYTLCLDLCVQMLGISMICDKFPHHKVLSVGRRNLHNQRVSGITTSLALGLPHGVVQSTVNMVQVPLHRIHQGKPFYI